jgi:hypothetical protein
MENRKGQLINNNRGFNPRGRTQRKRVQFRQQQVIGEKDLTTQRVGGPSCPPQKADNLPITRKTRFYISYSGTAVTYILTAAGIVANDAVEYFGSSTPVRFNQIQVSKIEAWFSLVPGATNPTSPSLSVEDSFSNVSYTDTPNVGVDWAHVAIRPCLSSRQSFQAAAATLSLAVIGVPAAAGSVGNIVFDVTFTGQ